ncbi:MAG TPA: hypothetical protein GX697_02770 [Firmicutes bacterium]|nr:hypothetical protein [Bacillota bacterium]
MPDILGFPLEEAFLLLKREGYTVKLIKTMPPPKSGLATDRWRVIKQKVDGRIVEITAAAEALGKEEL